jgi:Uma2 family endonuclease
VSAAIPQPVRTNDYPTSDGRPMAETDFHRKLLNELVETLDDWFRDDPNVYVSGNLLLFYEEGNKRRHVSPDVFVVFGVPKGDRPNYLLWEEGHGPNVVIELTSSSTRREDTRQKLELYRDVLRVPEYFLFDPYGDYLDPQLQGHRLVGREYRPLRPAGGPFKSRQLGLDLEADGRRLRLVDPATGHRLPNRAEQRRAAEERAGAEAEARQAIEAENERLRAVEAENERLRAELAALRKRPGGRNGHGTR